MNADERRSDLRSSAFICGENLIDRDRDRRRSWLSRREALLSRDAQRIGVATGSLRHASRFVVRTRHYNSLRTRLRLFSRSNGAWVLGEFCFASLSLLFTLALRC